MSAVSPGRVSEMAEGRADLVFTHDFVGAFVSVAGAVERITEYSAKEVQSMRLEDLLEPEFLAQALEDVMEQIGGGSPAPRRIILRTKSGKRIPMDILSRLVFERGRPVAVQGLGWETRGMVLKNKSKAKPTPPRENATVFTSQLRHIHQLNIRTYGSLQEVFAEFLRTGCEILNLPTGLVHKTVGGETEILAARGLPAEFSTEVSTLVAGSGIGSYLGAPILVDGNGYGRLSFFAASGAPRRFSPEEREVITLMGRGLGRVILDHQIRAESGRAALLERDRTELLEMVSSNRPLHHTLRHLVKMLERQSPGARGAVLLFEQGIISHVTAPSLPSLYARLARRIDLTSKLFRQSPILTRVVDVEDLSKELPDCTHPELLIRFGLDAAASAPIRSGTGQSLGLLILHYSNPAKPRPEDRGLLTMASRMAAIGIEQQHLARRLAFQAHHDAMTGLPNRSQLTEALATALTTMCPSDSVAAVLLLDLDRFKQINEVLGHTVGDQLIKKVAERLKSILGPDDIAARMGGDEFAVVLTGLDSVDNALQKPAKFIEAMRRPFRVQGQEVFATASIGVSIFPRDGDTAAALLKKAERAMQAAKRQGKNDWMHSGVEREALPSHSLEIENALRHALANEELKMHYQPILTMAEVLDGLEALLVWNHPKLGRISPGVFIPLAEEAGLIQQIGTWVVEEVCRQNAMWQGQGYAPVRVAANVSAVQFSRPEFFDDVRKAIEQSNLNPQWLELELTESVIVRDIEESVQSLGKLRQLGIRISIDDFGIRYSSLNYLRQLPLDTLKIDRSFLRDLTSSGGSLPLVQTIVSLAHNLNLQVIAEGVETREQLEILRATGCDKVQGHLYGTPVPGEEIESILRRSDRTLRPVGP